MDIKRTGCIVLTGLGIISFTLFSGEDNHYEYILQREDIRDALAIEGVNEIAVSAGQAMAKIKDFNEIQEIKENNLEENLEQNKEEVHNNETQKSVNEKNDITDKKDATLAVNTQDNQDSIPNFNKYVLDVIKTYSLEAGKYPYLLNNDFKNYNGVTEDIYYKGEILLKANPSGDRASNCTGITFEVFFKAMQKRNKDLGLSVDNFNGMSKDQLFDFALTWFVAMGDKSESNLAVAIEKYGLGNRIYNLEELRPGDFMDFSRENNTGHTAIFINWIREEGDIIGFKYWSSQGSTNGISYKEEYFNIRDKNGNKYGNVIIDKLHIGRVN